MTKGNSFLTTLLVGVAAGAIIGLLYAPDKGFRTRKKWNKQLRRAQKDLIKEAETLKERIDDYKDLATKTYDEIKDKVEDVRDKVMK
jgi:gas vesicle protein